MVDFGIDTVHRVVKKKRREYVLYEKPADTRSGRDLYLDVFKRGTVKKLQKRKDRMFMLKHLGLILGGLSVPLWLITALLSSFLPGAVELLGTFIGIVMLVIGLIDAYWRVENYKTLTEVFWEFDEEEYLPRSFSLMCGQIKIPYNPLRKYLIDLTDKEFIDTAKKLIDWNEIERTQSELFDELAQGYDELDEEFIEYAHQKMDELDDKLEQVKKERGYFLREIKKASSKSNLANTLAKAERALTLGE